MDVWAASGLGIGLAASVGVHAEAVAGVKEPWLHPVRQARLTAGGIVVGVAGEVHPAVLKAFDVKGPVVAVTLRIPALTQVGPEEPRRYVDLISVPVSARDLAVLVPETVTAAHVLDVAREAGGDLLQRAEVFDHYAGDQVPEGQVSLAIRLTIAEPGRTLTDEEIDGVTERAVAALRDQVGAELRS